MNRTRAVYQRRDRVALTALTEAAKCYSHAHGFSALQDLLRNEGVANAALVPEERRAAVLAKLEGEAT